MPLQGMLREMTVKVCFGCCSFHIFHFVMERTMMMESIRNSIVILVFPMLQSINQPVNQSTSQSTNQPVNQPINQSTNQSPYMSLVSNRSPQIEHVSRPSSITPSPFNKCLLEFTRSCFGRRGYRGEFSSIWWIYG